MRLVGETIGETEYAELAHPAVEPMLSTSDTTHPEGPVLIDNRYSITSDPQREGGMSTVHKAYDIKENRFVAIKRMKLTAADEMRWKESFHREYAALSDLSSHENIVELFEAGKDDQGEYIVLEWVESNLAEYVANNVVLHWMDYYTRIGRPVLEALTFAQGRSWNHRDIKPQNILVSSDGSPRISDYGIAKQFDKPSFGLTFNTFRLLRRSPLLKTTFLNMPVRETAFRGRRSRFSASRVKWLLTTALKSYC